MLQLCCKTPGTRRETGQPKGYGVGILQIQLSGSCRSLEEQDFCHPHGDRRSAAVSHLLSPPRFPLLKPPQPAVAPTVKRFTRLSPKCFGSRSISRF